MAARRLRARLNMPFDVALDVQGNIYLSDTFNHRVRRIDQKTGMITTVAGSGSAGFSGDGGPATKAQLNEPYGIVFDASGNLFVADRLNRRVRRVDGRTGIITTIAGNGTKSFSGDGGPAIAAGLVEPNGVALDRGGQIALHRRRRRQPRPQSRPRHRSHFDLCRNRSGTARWRRTTSRGRLHLGRARRRLGPDGSVYILEREGNTPPRREPIHRLDHDHRRHGRQGLFR